jgi:hypothetical protein
MITIDHNMEHLGYFDNEEEAARAFDYQASSLSRPVNFPGPGQAPAVKRGAHGIVSRYTGVTWHMRNTKWLARIFIDGKPTHVGYFDTEKAAARAYDERAGPLGLPVNFPLEEGQEQAVKSGVSKYEGVHWNFDDMLWGATGLNQSEHVPLGSFESEEAAARAVDDHFVDLGLPRRHFPEEGRLRQASVEAVSQFIGVKRNPKYKTWYAQVSIDGKMTTLGSYDSEEGAARAYDEQAAALGRPVNFPAYRSGQAKALKRGSSKYRGVTTAGKKWRADIRIDGKLKYLGTFLSDEAAAREYDKAAAPLGRAVNFPLLIEKPATAVAL